MNWYEAYGITKPYYADDAVCIVHADNRDILPLIPDKSVDLVLTDPPYGIDIGKIGRIGASKLAEVKDYGIQLWDKAPLGEEDIALLLSIGNHHIIFGGNYIADRLPASRCWLVWGKENTTNNFADCELLWTDFNTSVRIYRWKWNGMLQEPLNPKDYRWHPTQKPTGLLCAIIADWTANNDLILDPFLGSGTTACCAKKLNRRCIGIEIEEKYCEIAAKRCSQQVFYLSEKQPLPPGPSGVHLMIQDYQIENDLGS